MIRSGSSGESTLQRPQGTATQAFMNQAVGSVKELRLALVCYGGVSLAIYMHGIAKEMQSLVVASAAYEDGTGINVFAAGTTEHAWWNLLDERARRTGVRTRVVIDIVSGTSAGGINGICLAKAIACNKSQDALTDIWMNNGDISLLLKGPRWLPLKVRAGTFLLSAALRPKKPQAPLHGDRMSEWLLDAFAAMDKSEPALAGKSTLVGDGQSIDLSVTLTDFRGRQRAINADSPKWVRDRAYRHLLNFHSDETTNQFDAKHSAMLAFAARGTASFPGGFPPISLREFEATKGHSIDLESMVHEFFAEYELSGTNPADTVFIDGGVLDNAPFAATIAAIPGKYADTETDRRVLYIEPDPAPDMLALEAFDAPSWIRTIWGGIAGIPRKEPIVDDLIALSQRNQKVMSVRDVVESSFTTIGNRVRDVLQVPERMPASLTAADVHTFLQDACTTAAADAGFNYATYARLRIRSAIDGFASEVCTAARFPSTSFHASFVREMLQAWAAESDLLKQSTRLSEDQLQFMDDFDLGFADRQIRFAIGGLNWWYRNDGSMAPDRQKLDESKSRLYGHLRALHAVTDAIVECPSVVEAMKTIFDAGNIYLALDQQQPLDSLVRRHASLFDDMQTEIRERIGHELKPLMERLHADVISMCSTWNAEARDRFLIRYIGFPFWDVLTFPAQAFSGVTERDAVQVARLSPRDVSLLQAPKGGPKLAGTTVHHFGAFFDRAGREADYLWGRLDAVERLTAILNDDENSPGLDTPTPRDCVPVFAAVLDVETPKLTKARDLIADIRQQIDHLL